jgi:hypothetical protein
MRFPSHFLLLTLLPLSTLLACSKDKDEDPQPTSTGEMKYTYLGTPYTVTAATEVSAFYQISNNTLYISASPAGQPGVNFALVNVTAGGSSRTFQKGSAADDRPSVATLTRYDVATTLKPIFNTLYGPNPTNGQMTITGFDLDGGRISGTFTFTGGPTAGSGATGTAVVTNGSFSFTSITKI